MYAVAFHEASLIGDSAYSGGVVLIDRREAEILFTGIREQREEDEEEEGSVLKIPLFLFEYIYQWPDLKMGSDSFYPHQRLF